MPTSDTNPPIETTPAKAAQAPQGESALDGVARATLGVSLADIKAGLK